MVRELTDSTHQQKVMAVLSVLYGAVHAFWFERPWQQDEIDLKSAKYSELLCLSINFDYGNTEADQISEWISA